MKKIYYFYIVRCSDNSLYCGQTTNLKKRIQEHNSSPSRSAKYVRGKRPVHLVYSEECENLQFALKREYQVKQWPKDKKESLVQKK